MQKPTLGWQSWSPPYPKWHGLPHWDYSPLPPNRSVSNYQSSRPLKSLIRYWCSWYAYGDSVNSELILQTASYIEQNQLSFTHLLLDDGWCLWGDWLTPDPTKFTNLKKTLQEVKKTGLCVGLWFAPFLADRTSQLFKLHPEYFVRHHDHPVQGFRIMPIWDHLIRQRYLLNLDHPSVRQHLKNFLQLAIETWGVDLLKLDFLYAPYFNPNLQDSQAAHRQLNWLLTHIKKYYPQVQTIACGAPFVDCHNQVDAIRISKDTALPPVTPHLFNKIVYHTRVHMLSQALQADISPKLNLDPDVRMFTLDTSFTNKFWDSLSTPLIGIGDNLLSYNTHQRQAAKVWLKNHFSQS